MNKDTLRQVLIVLAVIAVIVINILANALPLNGLNTGEISDRFDIYFVPAGYVFSIWGLIYLGLLAYAIFQALPSQKENPRLRSIGLPFILSCLTNITWLFLWHYEVFLFTLAAFPGSRLGLYWHCSRTCQRSHRCHLCLGWSWSDSGDIGCWCHWKIPARKTIDWHLKNKPLDMLSEFKIFKDNTHRRV